MDRLLGEHAQLIKERGDLQRKLDAARADLAKVREQRADELFPGSPGPTKTAETPSI